MRTAQESKRGTVLYGFSLYVYVQEMTLLRICVREELGAGLADWLVRDIEETVGRMLSLDQAKEGKATKAEVKGEEGGEGEKNLMARAQEHEARMARPAVQSLGGEGKDQRGEEKESVKGDATKTFTIC